MFSEAAGANNFLGIAEIEFFPAPKSYKGKFGKAIDLSGEYFDLPINPDQETDSDGLSVAVWMYPRQVSGGFDNERMVSPPTMVAGIGPPPFVLVPSMPGQG